MNQQQPTRETFPLVPIKQRDVYSSIVQQLTDMLASGHYAEGDRLPAERELAQQLQVSRMGVREALKVLQSMGKVEIRHGAGTFVLHASRDPMTVALLEGKTIDHHFLAELVDVRVAIEVKVVELVIMHASDEELEREASWLNGRTEEYLAGQEMGSLDLQFEARLGQLTGNTLLQSLQASLHQAWVLSWGKLALTPDSKYILHQEHVMILEAIRQRLTERAIALMQRHAGRMIHEA